MGSPFCQALYLPAASPGPAEGKEPKLRLTPVLCVTQATRTCSAAARGGTSKGPLLPSSPSTSLRPWSCS